ncbi:hypothetical protein [Miltoncostaea marina]|uniref:hypothetical protein n=1 Tax=Miltoncostaea marina TaxID=2843215 RepID=UPI001C3E2B28|nr:hypothetical protein [Miltoncostaea marina]
MLDVHCPDCGRTLIGPRQIISMRATGEGIRVAYVCWCGRAGVEVTGRRRRPAGASRPPAPARAA